jgi:hypothetical protein
MLLRDGAEDSPDHPVDGRKLMLRSWRILTACGHES